MYGSIKCCLLELGSETFIVNFVLTTNEEVILYLIKSSSIEFKPLLSAS